MDLRLMATAACLLFTATDCAWDAAPNSDFITRSAGESVANMQVQQAREIWPPLSLDNDIVFEANRFAKDGDAKSKDDAGQSTTGQAQSNEPQ